MPETTNSDAAITWDVRPKIDSLFGLGSLIFGNFIRPQSLLSTSSDVTLGNNTQNQEEELPMAGTKKDTSPTLI